MITDKYVLESIEKIRDDDFFVNIDGNCVSIQKYSPRGHDFNFEIDTENDVFWFLDNILEYINNFDISQETYYWLDKTGHGTNGAPYDMREVYDDMEACFWYIKDVYEIVKTYVQTQEDFRL